MDHPPSNVVWKYIHGLSMDYPWIIRHNVVATPVICCIYGLSILSMDHPPSNVVATPVIC